MLEKSKRVKEYKYIFYFWYNFKVSAEYRGYEEGSSNNVCTEKTELV